MLKAFSTCESMSPRTRTFPGIPAGNSFPQPAGSRDPLAQVLPSGNQPRSWPEPTGFAARHYDTFPREHCNGSKLKLLPNSSTYTRNAELLDFPWCWGIPEAALGLSGRLWGYKPLQQALKPSFSSSSCEYCRGVLQKQPLPQGSTKAEGLAQRHREQHSLLHCAPGVGEDKRSFSRRIKCRPGVRDPSAPGALF